MAIEKRVLFSEVALAAIARAVGDVSGQESMKASVTYYLRRDAEEHATPCPAFPDRMMFIFAYWKYRVLFENADEVLVWSVLDAQQE